MNGWMHATYTDIYVYLQAAFYVSIVDSMLVPYQYGMALYAPVSMHGKGGKSEKTPIPCVGMVPILSPCIVLVPYFILYGIAWYGPVQYDMVFKKLA